MRWLPVRSRWGWTGAVLRSPFARQSELREKRVADGARRRCPTVDVRAEILVWGDRLPVLMQDSLEKQARWRMAPQKLKELRPAELVRKSTGQALLRTDSLVRQPYALPRESSGG